MIGLPATQWVNSPSLSELPPHAQCMGLFFICLCSMLIKWNYVDRQSILHYRPDQPAARSRLIQQLRNFFRLPGVELALPCQSVWRLLVQPHRSNAGSIHPEISHVLQRANSARSATKSTPLLRSRIRSARTSALTQVVQPGRVACHTFPTRCSGNRHDRMDPDSRAEDYDRQEYGEP